MRQVIVQRTDEPWWNFPWSATLYEDGYFRTVACASTRRGALKQLERKIERIDRPQPAIIYEEVVPYNEGVIQP